MTRAVSLLLRVVGLALVLVAGAGLVLVGDGGAWTATSSVPAGRTAVLVEPAVASVLGPTVTVRVAPADGGSALFLGRGRSDDLTAYAQDPHVVRVVGFDGSRRLKLQDGPAPTSATSATEAAGWRAPTTVDLWQQQVTGPGERALTWRPTSGAQSILVAREDGASLPALEFSVVWKDGRWLWYPVAALVLGLVMIVGGYLLAGGLPLGAVRAGSRRVRSALRSRGPVPARPGPVPEAGEQAPAEPAATEPATAEPTTEQTGSSESVTEPASEPAATGQAAGNGSATESASKRATQLVSEPVAQLVTERAMPSAGEPVAQPVGERAGELTTQPTQPISEPVGEVPQTRRAARGRRRKETAWQRARAKVLSRVGGRR